MVERECVANLGTSNLFNNRHRPGQTVLNDCLSSMDVSF